MRWATAACVCCFCTLPHPLQACERFKPPTNSNVLRQHASPVTSSLYLIAALTVVYLGSVTSLRGGNSVGSGGSELSDSTPVNRTAGAAAWGGAAPTVVAGTAASTAAATVGAADVLFVEVRAAAAWGSPGLVSTRHVARAAARGRQDHHGPWSCC